VFRIVVCTFGADYSYLLDRFDMATATLSKIEIDVNVVICHSYLLLILRVKFVTLLLYEWTF
jgi:hypothetical protein